LRLTHGCRAERKEGIIRIMLVYIYIYIYIYIYYGVRTVAGPKPATRDCFNDFQPSRKIMSMRTLGIITISAQYGGEHTEITCNWN